MKSILMLLFLLCAISFLFSAEIKRTANDAEADDAYGWSVSISGDYAVAGAFTEDSTGSNTGAAYILYRNQGGADNWGQVIKLASPNLEDGGIFGHSVSISGDDVLIGANVEDPGGNASAGAAYIFNRNQGGADNWGEVVTLNASDMAAGDQFGSAVAIDGDYAIVGARYENDGGTQAGAAYIFYRDEGGSDNWGEVLKLTASTPQAFNLFGIDVAISGDYAVVGAPGDNGGSFRGAAYVYYRNQGGADNWGQAVKLVPADPEDFAQFGNTVAIDGDNVAIGSLYADDVVSDAGAVYVFNRNQGGADNWGQVQKISASDATNSMEFSGSVAIRGNNLFVGAPSAGSSNEGAVYGYTWNGSSWSEQSITNSGDADANDYYGGSVAVDIDYSIVGAFFDDGAASGAGAAYIYQSFSDLSLPVSLNSFTAQASDSRVNLHWSTSSEENNEAFLLERSEDGSDFVQIAEITGQGNSNSITDYEFTDRLVRNGTTYHYRLSDRDFSGVITELQTVTATPNGLGTDIEQSEGVATAFNLHPNFPNPFNPETTIRFEVPTSQLENRNIELAVYNSAGQLVRTLWQGGIGGGVYETTWDGRSSTGIEQPSGVYLLRLSAGFFSQTRKMMLVK